MAENWEIGHAREMAKKEKRDKLEKPAVKKKLKKSDEKVSLSTIDSIIREGDAVSSSERTLIDQRRVYALNYGINTKDKTIKQIDKEITDEAKIRSRGNWKSSAHIKNKQGLVRGRDIKAINGVPWGNLSTKKQNEAIEYYLNKGMKVLAETDPPHLHIEELHGKKGFGRFGTGGFKKKAIRTGRSTLRVFGKKHKEFKSLLQKEEDEYQKSSKIKRLEEIMLKRRK